MALILRQHSRLLKVLQVTRNRSVIAHTLSSIHYYAHEPPNPVQASLKTFSSSLSPHIGGETLRTAQFKACFVLEGSTNEGNDINP